MPNIDRYINRFKRPYIINGLIWAIVSCIALAILSGLSDLASIDGVSIPVGHDSLYHARRILDAIAADSVYQFDPYMHAPEGSWVTWPLGYHAAAAALLQWAQHGFDQDPVDLLMLFPACWSIVNLLLFILILHTCRIRMEFRVLAAIVYCATPSFIYLHMVGAIDHHYLEHTFFQLTLLTGLWWFKAEHFRNRYALLFGLSLAGTHLVHNGLFILQLPLLGALFYGWLFGRTGMDTRGDGGCRDKSLLWLAASLVLGVFLIALPTYHFQNAYFDYYYLSWFHIYIAASTATILIFFYFIPVFNCAVSKKPFLLLIGLSALLSLPLLNNMSTGFRFLFSEMENLSNMNEASSILGLGRSERLPFATVLNFYSGFILLLPVVFYSILKKLSVFNMGGYRGVLDGQNCGVLCRSHIYLAIFGLLCLMLMLIQYRYHYAGLFLLIVISFQWLTDLADYMGQRSKQYTIFKTARVKFAAVALFSLLLISPVLNMKSSFSHKGLSLNLQANYEFLTQFAKICRERPGVVLANPNDGHLIRYFTDCAVIANNFIQTPLHEEKIRYSDRLFSMSLAALLDEIHSGGKESGIIYLYVNRLLYPDRPEPKLVTSAFNLDTQLLGQRVVVLSEHAIPWGEGRYRPITRLIQLSR